MAYTIFQSDYTGSADEVNDNFEFIGSGDLLPRTGVSLSASSAQAYDLGSDSYRWSTVYVNNVDMTGELTKCFNLISEQNISVTTNRIEFSGLNGDTDEIYNIICKIISPLSTFCTLKLHFNGDSATNYGEQFIYALDVTPTALRQSAESGIRIGLFYNETTSTKSVFNECLVYSKTGHHERTTINDVLEYGEGTFIRSDMHVGGVWNNTSDTITTIQLVGNTTTAFGTGTNIQLWAKR